MIAYDVVDNDAVWCQYSDTHATPTWYSPNGMPRFTRRHYLGPGSDILQRHTAGLLLNQKQSIDCAVIWVPDLSPSGSARRAVRDDKCCLQLLSFSHSKKHFASASNQLLNAYYLLGAAMQAKLEDSVVATRSELVIPHSHPSRAR